MSVAQAAKHSEIYIPKGYPLFAMPEEVAGLFNPLVKYTNIDYAGYGRIYADGGHFYMDNLVELQHYLLVELKGNTVFDFQLLDLIAHDDFFSRHGRKIVVFEQDIDSTNYWNRTSRMFNIQDLLYIFERWPSSKYFDIFAFASRSGKHINSFYISHFDVLERFILYFKETNKELIDVAEENKIILPHRNDQFYCIKKDFQGNSMIKESYGLEEDLFSMYKLEKYPVNVKGNTIYVTAREAECWKLFSRGYSHKKIGSMLGLSHKTVDSHLTNVKNKLHVTARDQLSKIFHSSDLSNL